MREVEFYREKVQRNSLGSEVRIAHGALSREPRES